MEIVSYKKKKEMQACVQGLISVLSGANFTMATVNAFSSASKEQSRKHFPLCV